MTEPLEELICTDCGVLKKTAKFGENVWLCFECAEIIYQALAATKADEISRRWVR